MALDKGSLCLSGPNLHSTDITTGVFGQPRHEVIWVGCWVSDFSSQSSYRVNSVCPPLLLRVPGPRFHIIQIKVSPKHDNIVWAILYPQPKCQKNYFRKSFKRDFISLTRLSESKPQKSCFKDSPCVLHHSVTPLPCSISSLPYIAFSAPCVQPYYKMLIILSHRKKNPIAQKLAQPRSGVSNYFL